MIELSIVEAWSAIPAFEKVFWYVALPFTLFGFISVISVLFGLGADGADADIGLDAADAAGGIFGAVEFFSVKNMIMFFAVFGWIGIVCERAGWHKAATISVASLSGIIAAVIFAVLFRLMYKLSESGTITSYESTVGEYGNVYLPIPSKREGTGKVQIVVHSSLREVDAVTDGDELPTGVKIKVKELMGDNTLVVEKA
ncbi:MAG: hypothetical protein P9L92_11590 [Candidatus Electryonea clarkiae]|nr:hypothetical protein [Candidatus Electryonea clarkiae]MDP8285628.1 hypothetical protein [Candidatus Electryonea clarkiae]